MKAIVIESSGRPEALQLRELDMPVPGPGQIRVRQEAIGVNFIDVCRRTGIYPVALPSVPGKKRRQQNVGETGRSEQVEKPPKLHSKESAAAGAVLHRAHKAIGDSISRSPAPAEHIYPKDLGIDFPGLAIVREGFMPNEREIVFPGLDDAGTVWTTRVRGGQTYAQHLGVNIGS
jgi:hypothetical protein